ncbi:MAG: hypothetical protein AAFP70_11740 [Calditrichota bacterium]
MKLAGGIGLIGVALFMLLGVFNMDADVGFGATVGAFLVAVVIPAVCGLVLIRSHQQSGKKLDHSRNILKQKTLEAEILNLAGKKNGKLTVVEVVREFAVDTEFAKDALDSLHEKSMAEIELTESGVIVYSFYDVKHLPEKDSSRGVLDA